MAETAVPDRRGTAVVRSIGRVTSRARAAVSSRIETAVRAAVRSRVQTAIRTAVIQGRPRAGIRLLLRSIIAAIRGLFKALNFFILTLFAFF